MGHKGIAPCSIFYNVGRLVLVLDVVDNDVVALADTASFKKNNISFE